MTTDPRTVEYIVGQLSGVSGISARKMFGEYGIFCDGKTVALVCNDQLFVKATAEGRAIATGAAETPPYRGAKPSLLIDAGLWDDQEWMANLIRATANALPAPAPKRPRKSKGLKIQDE